MINYCSKVILGLASMEEQPQPQPQPIKKRMRRNCIRRTIRNADRNEVIEGEDHTMVLPDDLLINIISRLPDTKQAIRTGILSKRWQHLWPNVDNLNFSFSKSSHEQGDKKLARFISSVRKTLPQCLNSNLKKFQLNIPHRLCFESRVNELLESVVRLNVKKVCICLGTEEYDYNIQFQLGKFFFSNSNFSHLELGGCLFVPSPAISWTALTSLDLSESYLNKSLIQNILSGCPLLEYLGLTRCYGYSLIDITSKSVKRLVFKGYDSRGGDDDDGDNLDFIDLEGIDYDDIVEINAPYVLSLTIESGLFMRKLSLLDVSSLIESKLDYEKYGHHGTVEQEREEMLKGFILKLRNVKELTVGPCCQEVFTRLKDNRFIFPSNVKVSWSE